MLRNQLHDSLSVMDHELLIRVLRNLDGESAPGGLFRSDCNYLELKYRKMVIVDRAVRSTNCVKRNAKNVTTIFLRIYAYSRS